MSTFLASGSGANATPSATSHTPDPHAVSEQEAWGYYAGIHSRPKLLYRTGAKWYPPRGLEAYSRPKELLEVFDHPITAVWNRDLGWKVVKVLDAHTIRFTTIDVVRFKMVEPYRELDLEYESQNPAISPVTIWIGVYPESTSATAAHDASQDVLALLEDYQITDVDVDFRGSYYIREAGPRLFNPTQHGYPFIHLEPLFKVTRSLTSALGLPISTKAWPNTEGTMALYLAEGGDSDNLLGLSCRHVLIGTKQANIDYVYDPSRPRQDVLVLGSRAFTNLVESIKAEIRSHDFMADLYERRIEDNEEEEKATGTGAERAKEKQRTQELLDSIPKAKRPLETLLDQVDTFSGWKKLNNRVLGYILRSPAIGLGVGEQQFTEDWAIFQIDRAKLGDGFRGNEMELATTIGPGEFSGKCFTRGDDNWKFEYPDEDTLLPLKGTITDDLMHTPDMWDLDGERCLLVVKNGSASKTTIGRANGVFSIVREYFIDMSIHRTSMEWAIFGYDQSMPFSEPGDSGAIIADIRGRIGGMLTGGCGSGNTEVFGDITITYATPFWWLLERIKANGFPNVHLDVA